jgi:hypothetical protein
MKKKMKPHQIQQEMLGRKHGEAKQFCHGDKLLDFGKAVEPRKWSTLCLTLNGCPIYVKTVLSRRD